MARSSNRVSPTGRRQRLALAHLLILLLVLQMPSLGFAASTFKATSLLVQPERPVLHGTDAGLGVVVTIERAELNKVLGEQELSLSGTVSAETAGKVGHLTGARVLVTGRVFRVGNENVIAAKIISTETSRVFGEMVKGRGEATELAADLAEQTAAKTALQKAAETLAMRLLPRLVKQGD